MASDSIRHCIPDGKANVGSAILKKNDMKYFEITYYATREIQSTNVYINNWIGLILISVI